MLEASIQAKVTQPSEVCGARVRARAQEETLLPSSAPLVSSPLSLMTWL